MNPTDPLSLNPVAAGGITGQFAYNQDAVNTVMASGAQLVGQLASVILQAISKGIQQGMQTLGNLQLAIASPIVDGLNQGQSTISDMATTVQQSIQGQLAVSPPHSGAGGLASQGVTPGQYAWNVYAQRGFDVTPGVAHWIGLTLQPTTAGLLTGPHWCFVGGWQNFFDGFAESQNTSLIPPDGACPTPGGPETPPVGAPPSLPGRPPPPPPPAPPAPPGQYAPPCPAQIPANGLWPIYVYLPDPQSVASGLCFGAITCGGLVPPGWTLQGGPFADQSDPGYLALTAQLQANSACGTPVTTQPPPPPPPPPPPECQCVQVYVSPGQCLGVQLCGQLPCIEVDLCDWSKFTKALVDALCEWYDKCVCKLDNQTAYLANECDPVVSKPTLDWLGSALASLQQTASVDDAASQAAGLLPRLPPGGHL